MTDDVKKNKADEIADKIVGQQLDSYGFTSKPKQERFEWADDAPGWTPKPSYRRDYRSVWDDDYASAKGKRDYQPPKPSPYAPAGHRSWTAVENARTLENWRADMSTFTDDGMSAADGAEFERGTLELGGFYLHRISDELSKSLAVAMDKAGLLWAGGKASLEARQMIERMILEHCLFKDVRGRYNKIVGGDPNDK